MTIEEFDKTGFTGQMKIEYKGEIHELASVDFEEKLVAYSLNDEDLNWVRCENTKLILPNIK